MNMAVSFGEMVRRSRIQALLTQTELANRAGLAQSYITALERGRRDNPSREVVTRLAKALGLEGSQRDAFLEAAHYLAAKTATAPAAASHPLLDAVADFLALPRGSPRLSDTIQRVVRELLGAAIHRGTERSDETLLRTTGLAAVGYFHRPAPREGRKSRRAPDKLPRSQEQLADRIARLLHLLGTGSVPISKRIRVAEELASYAKWKLGKDGPAEESHPAAVPTGGKVIRKFRDA